MSHVVQRLGQRGDGVVEGPIYVTGALPGETVTGEVVGGRIAAPKILTPSPDRVRPICRHAGSCGGCSLQHASDPFVERWKQDLVQTALAAHGLIAPILGITTSPIQSRRRAVYSARRTKKGALVGLHARASDAIIEGPDCTLVVPEIAKLLPELQEITRLGASRRAELSIAVTWTRNGADIAVSGACDLNPTLTEDLATLSQRAGIARIAWNGEIALQLKAPTIDFDGIETVPPPGAFLQATRHGEKTLRAAVQQCVRDARLVADLFAGCGTFALPLSRNSDVYAAEGDEDQVDALTAAWRRAGGLKRLEAETRDLFRQPLHRSELERFDAVVIDPPRAGAEAQVKELAESTVSRIALVSCNPTTFARDAAILVQGGYRLLWIEVVDQFRWSPHIELVAALSR